MVACPHGSMAQPLGRRRGGRGSSWDRVVARCHERLVRRRICRDRASRGGGRDGRPATPSRDHACARHAAPRRRRLHRVAGPCRLAGDQRIHPRRGASRESATFHRGRAIHRHAGAAARHGSSRRERRSAASHGGGPRDRGGAAPPCRARPHRPLPRGRDIPGRRLWSGRSTKGTGARVGTDARWNPVLRDHGGASDPHPRALHCSGIRMPRIARRRAARGQRSVQLAPSPTGHIRSPYEGACGRALLQRRRFHWHKRPTRRDDDGGRARAGRQDRRDHLAGQRVRRRSRPVFLGRTRDRPAGAAHVLLPERP